MNKKDFQKDLAEHVGKVREAMSLITHDLNKRALDHDKSKKVDPENTLLRENLLAYKEAEQKYGFDSKQFNEVKAKAKDGIEMHYANNTHHPEHFKNGVNDMNLLDLVEMCCDWQARSGNLSKSVQALKAKYKLSDQLVKILDNTSEYLILNKQIIEKCPECGQTLKHQH